MNETPDYVQQYCDNYPPCLAREPINHGTWITVGAVRTPSWGSGRRTSRRGLVKSGELRRPGVSLTRRQGRSPLEEVQRSEEGAPCSNHRSDLAGPEHKYRRSKGHLAYSDQTGLAKVIFVWDERGRGGGVPVPQSLSFCLW